VTDPAGAEDGRSGSPGPSVIDVAWQVVRAVSRRVTEELATEGFTDLRPAHCAVLYRISGGVTRVNDMAQRGGVTRQAVSLLVDQLHAAGYVERSVDPADRRAKVVALTGRGEAAAACLSHSHDRLRERWAEAVGLDRIKDCRGVLEDMAAALADQ
jgi:DNA-binding MarR family transcriptional regulator